MLLKKELLSAYKKSKSWNNVTGGKKQTKLGLTDETSETDPEKRYNFNILCICFPV